MGKGLRTPEEYELAHKRAELSGLETELVERELDLTTLLQRLATFEAEYLRIVGRRYAVLDDVEAQIAEAQAARHPVGQAIREEAVTARETADASAAQAKGHSYGRNEASVPAFDPPASLKVSYRSIAMRVHPDLAPTIEERERRNRWMARVNDAYKQQNEDALSGLLAEWETSPDSVTGVGVAHELVRVIRQLAQVRRRLHEIDESFDALKATNLHEFYLLYVEQIESGRNVLDEIAADVDEQIAEALRKLTDLRIEIV